MSLKVIPVPSKSIRYQLNDTQWTSCLESWSRITALALRLSDHDFKVNILREDTISDFMCSYLQEASVELDDQLSDDSRRLATCQGLTKNIFLLATRMLQQPDCPTQLCAMSSLAAYCKLFRRKNSLVVRQTTDKVFEGQESTLAELLTDEYICANVSVVTELCLAGDRMTDLISSRTLAQKLITLYSLPTRQKAQIRRLTLAIATNKQCSIKFLDTLMSRDSPNALIGDLLNQTRFLDRMQILSSERPALSDLFSSFMDNKMKSMDTEQYSAAHTDLQDEQFELMSKVSQLQDLFPDLDQSYIKKCLHEYDHDVATTTMQILEGKVPDQFKVNAEDTTTRQSSENATLRARAKEFDMPDRANIYDGDNFDQLTFEKSQIRFGRRSSNDADRMIKDGMSLEDKTKILSLAYDANDDELDDTYEDYDRVPALDQQTNDDLADGNDADLPSTDDLLFLTMQTNAQVFGRSARNTKDRQDLRARTNLSDEQIEGWKTMLDRDPARARKLAERNAFSGQQNEIKSSRWTTNGSMDGHETDRGRGRRRGAPIRARGATAQPSDKTAEQIRRDRAKKEVRGSGRGRGRGGGMRGRARPQG